MLGGNPEDRVFTIESASRREHSLSLHQGHPRTGPRKTKPREARFRRTSILPLPPSCHHREIAS
jgi:hypothetical protein